MTRRGDYGDGPYLTEGMLVRVYQLEQYVKGYRKNGTLLFAYRLPRNLLNDFPSLNPNGYGARRG